MKKLLLYIAAILSLAAFSISSAALAASNDQVFNACDQAPSSPVCQDKNPSTNPVTKVIKTAVDIVALMTGIAAVIMIIVSGLTMVASGGNSEAVANSRKRITYAVIGLVVVALAWTIITFLTDKLIKT